MQTETMKRLILPLLAGASLVAGLFIAQLHAALGCGGSAWGTTTATFASVCSTTQGGGSYSCWPANSTVPLYDGGTLTAGMGYGYVPAPSPTTVGQVAFTCNNVTTVQPLIMPADCNYAVYGVSIDCTTCTLTLTLLQSSAPPSGQ